jgi:hypothetical protein
MIFLQSRPSLATGVIVIVVVVVGAPGTAQEARDATAVGRRVGREQLFGLLFSRESLLVFAADVVRVS